MANKRTVIFWWIWRAFNWALFGVAAILLVLVAAAVLPVFMGNRTLVILSGSMDPSIPIGAAITAQPVASQDLQIGDVIVFSRDADSQVPIVHRIVDIRDEDGRLHYTTRGDANGSADMTEITLPATAWRVGYNVPLAGYVIAFAASPPGILSMILIPFAGLIALAASDRLKKERLAHSAAYISRHFSA